ncbi:putative T7SS-secreted protein [Cellulomonas taurus]|uniref:putative T7SS-secreted protein n=1 Tax=Cellulomonas taurus TaxID=2729175 RepID=UPI00145D34B2|nr:hypothetical protein [Cellulomonas taurus]
MSDLATCDDPRVLIDGDAETARDLADQERRRAAILDHACAALLSIDPTRIWQGNAGDRLTTTTRTIARRLDTAATAHHRAACVLDGYADDVSTARRRAATAVDLWQDGQRMSRAVRDAALPPTFDPGEVLREEAVTALAAARRYDTESVEQAAATIRAIADEAPDDGGFWNGVGGTWSDFWHGAGDVGAALGNGVMSFGNALTQHPDLLLEIIGGLGMMGVGGGIEVGGVLLDATGIGAVLGVPANVAGAGMVAAGGGLAIQGTARAGLAAMGDSAVQPFQGPSRGGGNGYRSPDAVPEDFPHHVIGYKDHALDRMTDRSVARQRIEELVDSPPRRPIWQPENGTWRFRSDDLTVVVNEFGEVVTAY